MGEAGHRARSKLLESFPDTVRETIEATRQRIRFDPAPPEAADPRIAALADAIRARKVVRIQARTPSPRTIHPVGLVLGTKGWRVMDALAPVAPIPLSACGDINVSARSFQASRV